MSVDKYDYDAKGDSFSATEILNPVQIVLLKRKHWNELEVDAIDRVYQVLGNGVHSELEKEEGIEKIERLKWKVLGKEVSGKWDRIINNEITDYKVTSVWTVIYGSRKDEWKEQLSIYRWLYWKNKGILLNDKGFIVAILRDWSEKDSKKANYPKFNAVQIELKLLGIKETEEFVTKKISALINADNITECTDAERWHNKVKGYIRCQKYCEVAQFCPQLKKEAEIKVTVPEEHFI